MCIILKLILGRCDMRAASYKKNLSIKYLHGPFFCNISNLGFNFDPSFMVRGNRRHAYTTHHSCAKECFQA